MKSIAIVVAVLLAGCGNGGGNSSDNSQPVVEVPKECCIQKEPIPVDTMPVPKPDQPVACVRGKLDLAGTCLTLPLTPGALQPT